MYEDAVISKDKIMKYVASMQNKGLGKKKSLEFILKYIEKSPPIYITKKKENQMMYDENSRQIGIAVGNGVILPKEHNRLIDADALTDLEQRIFLSAMRKEERLCRELDDEDDIGIKLLPVCKSIERKVKKALWG